MLIPRKIMCVKYTFLLFCSFIVLAGCATSTLNPGKKEVEQNNKKISSLATDKEAQHSHRKVLSVKKGHYVGSGEKWKLSGREVLPEFFDKEVVMVETRPLFLFQLAQKITEIAGVPIQVAPNIYDIEDVEEDETDSTGIGDIDMENDILGGGGSDLDYLTALSSSFLVENPNPEKMSLSYTGTLRGLLDTVTGNYGLYWEYKEGVVHLKKLKTKTYSLATNVGALSSSTSMGGGQDESGATEGHNVGVEGSYNIWEAVKEDIEEVLSEDGSVTFNEGAGTVTVSDLPTVLHYVNDYFEQLNHKLSQQVAIEVNVYSLTLAKNAQRDFSLDAIFERLGDYSITAAASESVAPSPGSVRGLTATILKTGDGLGKLNGSEVFFNVLSEQGAVSLVTSASGITLNNQSLPIQNLNKTAYLEQVSRTVYEEETTTELVPGELSTGFSMVASPHILDTNKVLLQYSLSISSLIAMREFASGEQTIQMPETNVRSFIQRSKMELGSTLVLAGFEESRAEESNNDSFWGLFGKGVLSDSQRDVLFITITVNDVK